MQSKNVVTADGVSLMHRVFGHKSQRVAFVTHSQAQHSLNLRNTSQAIADKGWLVHSTDLRGHGFSSSSRSPLAHMDINKGWERLVSDLHTGFETAFTNTPWEDRLVVAPNIGAMLTLEVLKSWTDLARHIVFITPPPNQPSILKLARSIVKARSLFHPMDKPDELTLHQLYSFLGARLSDRTRLIDVVSSDRDITDMLLEDEFAWPTPTTGYFHEMFRGVENAWKWPKDIQVKSGTSLLILYGGDDPMTANGKFVAKMREQLNLTGVLKVDAHCVEKGRSGLIIEEERFGISSIIDNWVKGELAPNQDSGLGDVADISSSVLNELGFDSFERALSADELVELCYNAIDDESRWIEMLYRVAYAVSSDDNLDESKLETIVLALTPHWERSYKLNKQIMQSAAIGAVLQNVIDRLNIGMAIVSSEMDISYANELFGRNFGAAIGRGTVPFDDLKALSKLLQKKAGADFINRCGKSSGEALLSIDDKLTGFHFRPAALKQTSLKRGGASGVLIIRNPDADQFNNDDLRHELIQFAYGMTAKEAETACCVVDGMSPNAISEHLNVSINTIRTHLKRVYEKTGVQGQSELASRLLKGPLGLLSNKQDHAANR